MYGQCEVYGKKSLFARLLQRKSDYFTLGIPLPVEDSEEEL